MPAIVSDVKSRILFSTTTSKTLEMLTVRQQFEMASLQSTYEKNMFILKHNLEFDEKWYG